MYRVIRFMPSVVFLAFLTWIIADANQGASNMFFELALVFPYGDKIGHVVLFCILTALLISAFGRRSVCCKGIEVYYGAIAAFGFALVEEFSQLYFPSRTFELADLVGSVIGVVVASLLTGKR